MGATINSREIIGHFYQTLEEKSGQSWADLIGTTPPFIAETGIAEYRWLGMSPALREWAGGRQARGFRTNGIQIENREFEATVEVLVREIRRDQSGQIYTRIDELAVRVVQHWESLLSLLIVGGETGVGYDGRFFFDVNHIEGDSGIQNNNITHRAVAPTAPTAAELEIAVLRAAQAILGFRDDRGEPMNAEAKRFLVMVPAPFFASAAAALKNPVIVDGAGARTNTLVNISGYGFELAINPRLTWTTKLAVFRTDAITKPIIRQEEEPMKVTAIAEGSEEEFNNNRHLYGVSVSRNAGYGMWQQACLVTLI